MLNANTRLAISSEHVAAKVIEGEATIINLANGLYYSLAGTGGELWTLIEQQHSLGEMAAALSTRYGVGQSEVAADVMRVAERLLEENLVLVSVDTASAPTNVVAQPETARRPYEAPVLQAYHDMAELLALDPPMPGLRIRTEAAPPSEP